MPLDHIGRPQEPVSTNEVATPEVRGWRGRSVRLPAALSTLAMVLVLAGCNTGTMNEARQSQTFDQAETPQLAAQQATRTAETFFAPTGTPPPPTPAPPALETLVITLGVGPDGGPSGSYLSVPVDAGTAYAAGRLRDVRAGQKVAATWTDAFGNVMGTFEIEMAADAAAQWVSVPLQLNGALGAGEYAVYLFGGGRQLGSLAFSITGPGSGAQLLPDLPANPQARSTMAPRQSESRENEWDSNQEQSGGEWQQQDDGSWQQQNDGTWQQSDGSWQEQSDGSWQQQNDGTWQQDPSQSQWNENPQDQWNQAPQDQWSAPMEGESTSDWN